jgi:hypothetical protein
MSLLGPVGFPTVIPLPELPDEEPIISRIANVLIQGRVLGTIGGTDHFGIVAEEIARVQVGNVVIPLRSGAHNDIIGYKLGSTSDVTARETEAQPANRLASLMDDR